MLASFTSSFCILLLGIHYDLWFFFEWFLVFLDLGLFWYLLREDYLIRLIIYFWLFLNLFFCFNSKDIPAKIIVTSKRIIVLQGL